jgi:hypothetical protein
MIRSLENQSFPVKIGGVPDRRRLSIIVLDNAKSLSGAWRRVKSLYIVQAPSSAAPFDHEDDHRQPQHRGATEPYSDLRIKSLVRPRYGLSQDFSVRHCEVQISLE